MHVCKGSASLSRDTRDTYQCLPPGGRMELEEKEAYFRCILSSTAETFQTTYIEPQMWPMEVPRQSGRLLAQMKQVLPNQHS